MSVAEPAIQQEAGALWNDGCIQSVKPMLDMRKDHNIVWNEVEQKTEFMGWWFCCVPMACLQKNGLPLKQLYFHRDDVELGLRNPEQLTLAGIAVWHESFASKASCIERYYDTRNMPIVNAIHGEQSWKEYYRLCTQAVYKEWLRHRYNHAAFIMQGAEDFCKGRHWVQEHNSGAFFNELAAQEPPKIPANETDCLKLLTDRRSIPPWPLWKRILLTYLLMNGLFLPFKKEAIVSYRNPAARETFHTRTAYSVSPDNRQCFINRLNGKTLFQECIRLIHLRKILKCRYISVVQEWKDPSI